MADLPYTHETVGEYNMTDFFRYDSPVALAGCMKNAMRERLQGIQFSSCISSIC